MKYVFDLEADGHLHEATKMWCAAFYDLDSHKTYITEDPSEALRGLMRADLVVGHNLTGYDFPLLLKLLRPSDEEIVNRLTNPSVDWCKDTYEISLTLMPERPGGHSVEAWANRLRLPPKVEINDWKNLDISLYRERAAKDVWLEAQILYALDKEMENLVG